MCESCIHVHKSMPCMCAHTLSHVQQHTCTCMCIMHACTWVKQLIATCFTQKENTSQFLLTSINWRIISVNACKCAHTENWELDSHARRKEKILFIGKLSEHRVELKTTALWKCILKTRLGIWLKCPGRMSSDNSWWGGWIVSATAEQLNNWTCIKVSHETCVG